MKKNKFIQMSDDEIKTLKQSLRRVKRLKIFKELEKVKQEGKTEKEQLKKVA